MESNIVNKLISSAIEEDIPWGDVTTDNLIGPFMESELIFTIKEDGVIAGLPVAKKVFKMIDDNIIWTPLVQDGDIVRQNAIIAKVRGRSRALLKAERIALNFLQRLSGIASLTRQYVESARTKSETVRIVDTRKTTPGLRYLEKYAVRVGGGYNHRYCLSDAILIKDNHLAMLYEEGRSIRKAVSDIKKLVSHTITVEVEIDSVDQLEDALLSDADILLLDNMSPKELKQIVKRVNGRKKLEASGNIRLETVADMAETGVDYISVGSLTHSAKALDISLDFLPIFEESYGEESDDSEMEDD